MDSFLSILPKGLFGRNPAMAMAPDDSSFVSSLMILEENERKRPRDDRDASDCGDGSRTPTLISTSSDDEEVRPLKRFRGDQRVVPVAASPRKQTPPAPPKSPLRLLPEDVTAHCLSFLGSVEDRFSLQSTCKQFQKISSSDEMMANIQVGGDRETGHHGIIQESDDPDTASEKLAPFARAGNLEAMYM